MPSNLKRQARSKSAPSGDALGQLGAELLFLFFSHLPRYSKTQDDWIPLPIVPDRKATIRVLTGQASDASGLLDGYAERARRPGFLLFGVRGGLFGLGRPA